MGRIVTLVFFISRILLSQALGEDEIEKSLSGDASSSSTTENPLLPLLLQLAEDDDEKRWVAINKLAQTGDLRLERFFELYRQGSVYNWPDKDGVNRIVVNEETITGEDLITEFAPLYEPLTGDPFMVDGKQARPDLMV